MILIKILLFIILAIIGIILLLLLMPIRVKFSFINEKLVYSVKYSFFNIIDSSGGGLIGKLLSSDESESAQSRESDKEKTKSAKENEKKQRSKPEPAQKGTEKPPEEEKLSSETKALESETEECGEAPIQSDESEQDKKDKKTPGEMVGFIMDIWRSAKRPVRKIFKGFRFSDVYIDFLIADEDAYKCALSYGRICGVVYNGLSVMSRLFTARLKTVDIECGFGKEKSRWDASFTLSFVSMTAVISGIWFLITYIFRIYLPGKRAKRKETAAKQETQPQGGM